MTMPQTANEFLKATCPRCGYDQSGQLAPGAPAWPLRSHCAECGLAIEWSAYFRSAHRLPRWWIEHAPWRRFLPAVPLTIAASMFGAPLWLRLEMPHSIRWGGCC
ncbi:MAG: hypothetical protein SGJ11_02220 [Phycisphaerae bacterium]|nr:hypothetical protein [Phycisphaerae bacterium]